MLTNPSVPKDLCVCVPISHLLTMGSMSILHSLNSNSVFNAKVVVAAFNQEKALVGAYSMIVKTGCGTDGSICGTKGDPAERHLGSGLRFLRGRGRGGPGGSLHLTS